MVVYLNYYMDDIYKKDGSLFRERFGNSHLVQDDSSIPIFKITGSDSDFDSKKKELFRGILNKASVAILNFIHHDSELEKISDLITRLKPSVWKINVIEDTDRLYEFLKRYEWSIYTFFRIPEEIDFYYRGSHHQITWMKYHRALISITNDYWVNSWTFGINPDVADSESPAASATPVLDQNLPTFSRLLGMWVPENRYSEGSYEEEKDLQWFISILADQDRKDFLEQSKYFIRIKDYPEEEIRFKAKRKFPDIYHMNDWVLWVIKNFNALDKRAEEEKKAVEAIKIVIERRQEECYKKKIAADFACVKTDSINPYSSYAMINIRFPDKDRKSNIESHIQVVEVPIYKNGKLIDEIRIKVAADKEMEYVLSEAPYMRIWGMPRPAYGIPSSLAPLAVAIIVTPFLNIIHLGAVGMLLVFVGILYAVARLIINLFSK